MASDPRPPDSPRAKKNFDQLMLDRTVIAVPLLEQMQEELARIAEVEQQFPGVAAKFNAAIVYNAAFPGGTSAARDHVAAMLPDATNKAREAASMRVKRSSVDALLERAKQELADLDTATAEQTIEPLNPDTAVGFARLHASVRQRLLSLNEALVADGRPLPAPILRIHPNLFEVIIDLNLDHPGGRDAARAWVLAHIEPAKTAANVHDAGQRVHFEKSFASHQYIFARLEARAIQQLVALDLDQSKTRAQTLRAEKGPNATAAIDPHKHRAIYHIWPDFELEACVHRSIATVKANAAQVSFSARGEGITWAVIDSGIDADHKHFAKHGNIDRASPWHRDFTPDGAGPFDDEAGHGTHVAGIIGGEYCVPADAKDDLGAVAVSRYLKTGVEDVEVQQTRIRAISGMAPLCKLVSLRVLDANGKGKASNLIAALNHIQEINGYGRRILIHGVNLSLGYNFMPEWFACGQSPLCVEVDRLVKSGVVVVVAAGNTGYGTLNSKEGAWAAGMAVTINDPGNADLAITVGSTHRDKPHVYGVSFFSSKGPTGDGRLKPDLVAPGEKIISCATGRMMRKITSEPCDYLENSGTSMAAPHVSGVIAAFLSVRGEFIGQAERVKEIFLSTATDLRRDRYFQGAGLVDLMRAIQSI